MNNVNTHSILLFDGVCNLCNNAINFVIKRDKKNVFKFAALQEAPGKKLLNQYQINTENIDSIVLIENNKAYVKSSAALRAAKHLSGGWPLLYAFIIVPKFIRDAVYNFIAKNRYQWYGKKESCMIPTPELKSKFLK